MAVRLGDPVEKSFGRDDINDRYHRYDKILGRGAYKTVYWGWDTAEGVDVAWNCIDLDMLPSREEQSKILREVEMLQHLNHKHILRIRDHWDNPKSNQLCFITDILQGGSLREYIRQREVNLLRVKSWCVQILDALRYLHGSSPVIIHRDLKCDNIFIDGPSGKITIGDLGLSTKYAHSLFNSNEKGMSIVGTPEFMAPELYEEQYDEKVDIYSFGMCILEMISKKYPYEECTNQIQVIRKVTEKKQPDILRRLHRYVRTFIEICIERDPKKRPSAQELLKHPFLSFMDDLKNKWSVSDFVFEEDRTIMYYKEMENKTRYKQQQRQLSMIKEIRGERGRERERENVQTSNSKSPSPKINTKRTLNKCSKKARSKKKYVSGTTVSVEDGGKISVKLKIHHDKESQKVKFQYDPQTEDIQAVVREMVETLELDRSRETEIVNAIKTKLNDLETLKTHTIPPQRAATQPPQTQGAIATQTLHTPKTPNASNAPPISNGFTQTQSVFPKVFNANGTAALTKNNNNPMPITALLNKNKRRASNTTKNVPMNKTKNKSKNQSKPKIKTTQSAPVSPGHSPETQKMIKFKASTGYTSDTASDFVREQDKNAPKLVSDSLLDQIMALPRETIKARIIQFGGTFNDEDGTGILVTKLFQLLSDKTNNNKKGTEDEHTPALIMQHTQKSNNLNVIKINGTSYHGASTSDIASSIHCTPPDIMNPLQRNISPPNESVYPSLTVAAQTTRQASNDSVGGYSQHTDSPKSMEAKPRMSPKSKVTHHRQPYNKQPLVPQIMDDDEEDPDEVDPNIELPKLRLRQKELMKGKIVYEMERLKQRNCAQLGRDTTIDNIASELAQVEKKIKILTDASKTVTKIMQKKQIKTPSDSNINIQKEDKDKDRDKRKDTDSHSAESLKDKVSMNGTISNSSSQSLSLLVDTTEDSGNHISSPLVPSAHRDQFESHLQRLPNKLNLSEITCNLDKLFNLHEKNVSFEVFKNAKDRICRENKQLQEEYNQYYEDQTEMLLLKLQKHRNNHGKLMSETQSTQNKLLSKQGKQRNKFKSIVDDQLQILQLTQELNDDNAVSAVVPQDEFYLYKEEIDKVYLERVKHFEVKQKKELDAFRNDLRELKHLKLEIRKKHQQQQMLKIASNPSSPKQLHPTNRRLHTQSQSTPAIQIDILTGLDLNDEQQITDAPPLMQPHHYHSSSLPLIDHTKINNVTHPSQSKFKVSHIRNPHQHHLVNIQHHTPSNIQHHPAQLQHQHKQHIHAHSKHSLNNSFDINNNNK